MVTPLGGACHRVPGSHLRGKRTAYLQSMIVCMYIRSRSLPEIPPRAASCLGFNPKGSDCLDSALLFRSESQQTWGVSGRQASAMSKVKGNFFQNIVH